MQAKISVRNLFKIFGKNTSTALKMLRKGKSKSEILQATGATVGINNVSFDVEAGEIFVVMGLSGSGKSTLVRTLNGLIAPTAGQILIDGEDIAKAGKLALRRIRRKKIAMVFQHFALFPHWTVAENVAYGLKVRGVSQQQCRARALEVLAQVGLENWADSLPSELSGGMQQRVGLARGLAADPDILLMDEPFGALDPLIRRDMQSELLKLQATLKKTIVFITHDLNEALLLGNRIAIMKDGAVVQIGTAQDIVSNPADEYVAAFVADIDRGRVFTARDVISEPGTVQLRYTNIRQALAQMVKQDRAFLFVVEKGKPVGLLRYQDLAVHELDTSTKSPALQDLMITDFPKAHPDTMLSDLYAAAGTGLPIAVVGDSGRLLAVIEPHDVLRHLSGDNGDGSTNATDIGGAGAHVSGSDEKTGSGHDSGAATIAAHDLDDAAKQSHQAVDSAKTAQATLQTEINKEKADDQSR